MIKFKDIYILFILCFLRFSDSAIALIIISLTIYTLLEIY